MPSSKEPIHPEWDGMARKVLKGTEPSEKLMWKTPEVCFYYLLWSGAL